MYYPLKQTDPIYKIDCSLYKPSIWALTWDDVVSFVARNKNQDYEIRRLSPDQILSGAAIILGVKDKREGGDYSLEEFGGWLIDGCPTEIVPSWKKMLIELRDKLKARYPEWADKWYDNTLSRILKRGEDGTERVEYLTDKFNKGRIKDMISSSFVWENTPEGHNYWRDIEA